MRAKGTYQKVNLRINKSVEEILKEKSQKIGITKSQYFRNIIENIDVTDESFENSKELNEIFCTFVENETLKKIDKLADSMGISRNSFINIYLKQHLFKNPDNNVSKTMNFASEYNDLSIDVEKLSNEQLLKRGQYFNEIVNTKKLLESIELLDLKLTLSNNLEHRIKLDHLKIRYNTHVGIYSNNIEFIKTKVLPNAIKLGNKVLLSKTYSLLSSIYNGLEQTELAYGYIYKAYDYLDPITSPIELAKVYLDLANLYFYELDIKRSLFFQHKGNQILERYGEKNILARSMREESTILFFIGKTNEAKNLMENSKDIRKNQDEVLLEDYYFYKYKGLLNLVEDKFEQAHSEFKKSVEIEQKFRPNVNFSPSNFMKLFVEARSNYDKSINEMNRIVQNTEQLIKKDNINLIIAASKYIFSNSEADILQGRKTLEELSYTNSKKMYKLAAKQILETKKFAFVK